jgi:hypothetical protein
MILSKISEVEILSGQPESSIGDPRGIASG